MRKFVLGMICLSLLGGCAETRWVHSYKLQETLNQDKWDCEQDLAMRQTKSVMVLGKMAFGGSSKPDDKDIERCLQLKHGWKKEKVSR